MRDRVDLLASFACQRSRGRHPFRTSTGDNDAVDKIVRPLVATAAATVLALVSLTGCSYGASGSTAATATSTPPSTTAPSTTTGAPISPTISLPQGPAPTDPAVDGYPLGQPVALDSGYTVTVEAVDLDATAEMATLLPEVSSSEGRLVLVTMSARPTEGVDPNALPPLVGSMVIGLDSGDERFGYCENSSDLVRPALAVPVAGQTVTWQECLDVTPEAATSPFLISFETIRGGTLVDSTYWSVN